MLSRNPVYLGEEPKGKLLISRVPRSRQSSAQEPAGAAYQLAAPEEIPALAQRLKTHLLPCMLCLRSLDLSNISHMFFLTLFSVSHQKLQQTCHFWKNNLASNFCQNGFSLRPRGPRLPKVAVPRSSPRTRPSHSPSGGALLQPGMSPSSTKSPESRGVWVQSLMHWGKKKKNTYRSRVVASEQHYTENFVCGAPAQSCSLQRNLLQEKPAQRPVSSRRYLFFIFF